MGGYGALRVGLGYARLFCSIHSSGGSLDRTVDFSPEAQRSATIRNRPAAFIAEMRRVFGDAIVHSNHDVLRLARESRERGELPRIWIDCGTEDYLLTANRSFHRDLEAAGVEHEYHEMPGSHGWAYAGAAVEKALAFHLKNLNVSATSQ